MQRALNVSAETAAAEHCYYAFVNELAPCFPAWQAPLSPAMGGSCIRPASDTAGSTWPQWRGGVKDLKRKI